MKKLVLFSGGLDSTVCLAKAISEVGSQNVIALSIYYGQKHNKEIECSKKIVSYYNCGHVILDLGEIFKNSKCSLLLGREDIPHESYDEQLKKTNGKAVTTYVPFRNGLFLSSAASIALSNDCDTIYYGAHADDAAGNAYPDTSIEFNEAINNAIYLGSDKQLKVVAPFISSSKSDVVRCGISLNVPFELTFSCYEGHDKACGKCGTCLDRLEAFRKNNMVDPIEYEVE